MNFRKMYLPIVLGALILMPGCTRTLTRYVPRHAQEQNLREANAKLAGKTATLHFVDGRRAVKAEKVHIEPGAISYVDGKTGAQKRISAANIQKITFRDHKRGLKDGAKTGLKAWGGLALGLGAVAIALAAGSEHKNSDSAEPDFEIGPGAIAIAAAVVTAPVLLTSTATGAAAGSKTVYVMGDKSNSKARKAGKR